MHPFLDGVREILDRINNIALASCGACGAGGSGANPGKERGRLEPGLARLFDLRPLGDNDSEAVKATQRGARLLHEGRVEESLREFHDAKRLVPRSAVARCNLGAAYFERGDEDAALHWFREAHRLAPHDEIATLAMALLEQRCGQLADAQWLLVNFLQEVDSNHPKPLRQLARLHQQMGQHQQAAGCYRRLVVVEPSNSEWPRELQQCLDQGGGSGGRPPPEYGGGEAGFRGGDALGASYGRDSGFSVERPNAGAGKAALGSRYGGGGGKGGPPGAFDAVDEGGKGKGGFAGGGYDPGGNRGSPSAARGFAAGSNDAATVRDAARLRQGGQTEAALSAYRNTLRADRTNAEALQGVAECLQDLGQHDSAIEAGKQLLSVRPDQAESNLLMAELLIHARRPAYMAEPYLQRAQAAPPGDTSMRSRLLCATAEAALATDDYKKALSSAQEAVRVDASEPRALIVLADARIQVADYEAALRALGAALDVLRGRDSADGTRLSATAHMLSAQSQERLRQYPQALDEVQRALDLDPRLTAARVVRATALQQSGRDREATAELQEVLKLEPQNVAARLQLGYVQLSAGDRRAVSTLEGAVSGASGSRSSGGAAKVYLALALDAESRAGGGSNQRQRAEQVLKEGLAVHRNLQVVWRDVEGSLLDKPASAAVQRLRGICDLDLTSSQARALLQLLVRSTGRQDLMRALGFSADGRASGIGTPERLRSTAGSRAGSVPPNRYAPELDANGTPARMRSGSPGSRSKTPWNGMIDGQRPSGRMQNSRPHSPGLQPRQQGYGQGEYDQGQPSRGQRQQADYGMQESRPHSPGMQGRAPRMSEHGMPPGSDQGNRGGGGGHRGAPPDGYKGMHGDRGMQGSPEQAGRGRNPPSRPRSPGMHGRSSGQGAGGYGGMQGPMHGALGTTVSPGMQGGPPWHMQGGMQGPPHGRPDQLNRSAPNTPQEGGYRNRLQGI